MVPRGLRAALRSSPKLHPGSFPRKVFRKWWKFLRRHMVHAVNLSPSLWKRNISWEGSDFPGSEKWKKIFRKSFFSKIRTQFSMNFHDNLKNKNQKNWKIYFSFVSAYCTSSLKTGSKLWGRGGRGGLHILSWEKPAFLGSAFFLEVPFLEVWFQKHASSKHNFFNWAPDSISAWSFSRMPDVIPYFLFCLLPQQRGNKEVRRVSRIKPIWWFEFLSRETTPRYQNSG